MDRSNLKSAASPIGIFDSGIGGLTVAHAIRTLMPNESLVYFGDTAHLPYGDKSEAAIQAYSVKIADVLLRKQCKVIVIACNSASSAAYELLKEYVRVVDIMNVIDPMLQHLASNFKGKRVGLIGTKRTVQSNIYTKRLADLEPSIELRSLATPLLAPMIEERFHNSQISHEIITEYLSAQELSNIEAMVLACTHYPLIKREISTYYKSSIPIIDSSDVVASALKVYLDENELAAPSTDSPTDQFLVSDFTPSFEASTKIFFQQFVHLDQHRLWN